MENCQTQHINDLELTVEDLFIKPAYKYISFIDHGNFKFNFNAPIISGGYREQMPSCIACASLDTSGFAGLAHIGPYENGTSYASAMYNEYMKSSQIPANISFIIAGTNHNHVDEVASFLRRKNGLRVKPLYLNPNPSGVIDMGVNPETRKLLIHKSFDGQNMQACF